MPIEFPCPGCQKTLRVPDDAAGKSAKCPQCGAVALVPMSGSTVGAVPPPPGAPNLGGNPFAGGALPTADANPYAAPASLSSPYSTETSYSVRPIVPTPLNIGEVLSFAWSAFRREMGMCILAAFIVMAVNFGFSMIGNIGQAVISSARDDMTRVLGFGILAIAQIVSMVVQTWLNLGVAKFNLGIARGGRADINDVFRGGPYLWRAILASMLIGVGVVLCMSFLLPAFLSEYWLIVGIPVALIGVLYISFTYGQFMYLIVERNLDVFDSLNTSAQIMAGNRLSLFVLGLVCGGIMLLGLLACFVGLVFAIPYVGLIVVVAYLQMTGQWGDGAAR